MAADTSRFNPDEEYQFKVITYTAVCLSENPDVDNFIIYTNKEELSGFDDMIVKVWYKSQPKPFVYLGQIKHRTHRVNLNNKANSLSNYKNNMKDIFAKKESIKFLKELFASVPDENVEFWFFCSNFLTNTNIHPIIVDEIQYHEVKYDNPKSIYPFTKNAGCYKLTSNDTTKASGDLERFYLFLGQPDIDKINDHILNCHKETFTMETIAQIITYVTEYLKGRIGSRGLRKDVFQIQLLKLCLSLVTISPTEGIKMYGDLASFWNELTLEHDVTIVDEGEVDMKPYLFGAFSQVLQKLLNDVDFNWNKCISNSHKLPKNFNFDKFVQLTKRNNTYYWLSKPDILNTLLVELWKCDYIPLILSSECNISILTKYQHLNKKFIVLTIDHKISNELRSFGLNVCADMSNIRSDSKRRHLLESISISLQGREPVKFANVIGNDKNIMSEIRCSHLLNLSEHVCKIFVNKECLEHGSSMVFIITHDLKCNKVVSDDWRSSFGISLKSTFKGENVIINCESSEVGKYTALVKTKPNAENYSMYRLKRHPNGKLEYLFGDLIKIRHFVINLTETQVHIQEGKLTPIVGTILCKQEDQYMARYLQKATVETSFLNFEEERIVFLTGDVDSLETKIKEKIIDEFFGDVEIRIEKILYMKKSAFVSVENGHLEEHWSKFSSKKYPIFHIQVNSGALILVKYKNYQNLGHYIAYESQPFPEKNFFEETSPGVSIISGEVGVGKTTLLHSLFEQYDNSNFVLFFDLIKHLNEIQKGSKSKLFKRPLKYILSRSEHSLPCNCLLPNGFFDSLCEYHHKTNRLLLIIDSFDDALRIHREEVLELVRIITNNNVRVIIACGPISESLLINNFEVQPIRIEDVDRNSALRYLKNRKLNDADIKNIPEEFLENPLYLEFLSACSKDILSRCYSNNSFPLYSAIIQKQIQRFCAKNRDANNLKYREDEILNVHKRLALASIVGKKFIEDQVLNYDDYVQECMDSYKIDLGIITGFNNGNPIFARRTFAEFLVALWISENFVTAQAQKAYRILLDNNEQNVRLLLDNYICENLKLHEAILRGDLQVIENICAEDRNYLACTDKFKRTPLHLAASYCQDNNNSMYIILETIVQHMNKERCNFLVRDLLMERTWFEYVKRNNNFFEELCRHGLCATLQRYLDISHVNINENDVNNALLNNRLHTAAILLKYNPTLVKTNFDKLMKCCLNICELNSILDLIEMQNASYEKYIHFRKICQNTQSATTVKEYTNFQISGGFTALHLACIYGNIEVVIKLVELEVDLFNFDRFENLPLHYAVMRGSSQLVTQLIKYALIPGHEANHNINAQNCLGRTPLHIASIIGREDIVHTLLENGANINYSDKEGNTALHFAVHFERLNVLQRLLEKRTIVNYKDNSGSTILHYAVQRGNIDIVNAILAKGANIDIKGQNGNTALHIAISYEHMNVIELLLKMGPNTNIQNDSGNTALHSAVTVRRADIVKVLLENDANVNIKGHRGRTPLHMAVYSGQTDIFKMILDKRADVDVTDYDGDTALHCAVKEGNTNIVEMLLQKDFDTTPLNLAGRALHLAALRGRTDIVEILLKQRLDVKVNDIYGRAALRNAALEGHIDTLKLLLERGADVNIIDYNDNTALHLAAKEGKTDIVEILLKQGLDVNLRGSNGRAPLHFAALQGHIDTLKLLLERGADVNIIDTYDDNTALHLAAKKGKTDIVEILLKQGLDVNLRGSNGRAPLHFAAFYGHIDTLSLLIENEADVNVVNDYNDTVLHIAAKEGKTNIVELLLNKGMDINLKGWKGWSPLCNAVFYGHIDTLRLLLENGADVNVVNDNNDTVLHIAAKKGKTNMVELLLNRGMDIDLKGWKGWSPLCFAAFHGYIDTLRLLLKRGADVDIIDDDNNTALHLAAKEGKIDIVEILLKQGLDVNLRGFNGRAPLHFAAFYGHIDTLRLFLENGGDVNAVSDDNDTAIHLAAKNGKTNIVELLLNRGMDIDLKGYNGWSPLCFAAFRGHIDTLRLLLKRGADVNILDDDNNTALHLAAKEGKTDIVEILLKRGAEVNILDDDNDTALHLAAKEGRMDIVEILLKRGLDVNLRGSNGRAPLHVAAFYGLVDTLRLLLENGADVNAVNYDNDTAIHLAAKNGKTNIVELLLNRGMDIDLKGYNGWSPLCFAAFRGHIDTLRLLLKRGADVNILDNHYDTALHLAAEEGETDIVEILLEKGLDVNIVNDDNDTVLHIAAKKGKMNIVELLLKKGMDINLKGYNGWSPLCFAAFYGHIDTLRLLLKNEADVNIIDDDNNTALHLAAKEGKTDIVEILLKQGLDVTLRGSNGRAPLHFAALQGHISTLRLLLESGTDVNILDDDNDTALHLAAKEGRTDIVEILLKQGLGVNLQGSNGRAPLHFTAQYGHVDTLELLLEYGADVNTTNDDNITALDVALQKRRRKIIELLLSNETLL